MWQVGLSRANGSAHAARGLGCRQLGSPRTVDVGLDGVPGPRGQRGGGSAEQQRDGGPRQHLEKPALPSKKTERPGARTRRAAAATWHSCSSSAIEFVHLCFAFSPARAFIVNSVLVQITASLYILKVLILLLSPVKGSIFRPPTSLHPMAACAAVKVFVVLPRTIARLCWPCACGYWAPCAHQVVHVFGNFPPNARGGGQLGTRVPRREREKTKRETEITKITVVINLTPRSRQAHLSPT